MDHPKYVVDFGTSESAGSSARPPLGYPPRGYPSHPSSSNTPYVPTAYPLGGVAAPSPNSSIPGIQPIDPYPPACPPPVAPGGGVNTQPPPPSFTAYGRVSVLDEKYITALSNVDLTVDENLIGGGYTVKDGGDNLMFQVKGKFRGLHKRTTIYDDKGNPIVNMKKKMEVVQEGSRLDDLSDASESPPPARSEDLVCGPPARTEDLESTCSSRYEYDPNDFPKLNEIEEFQAPFTWPPSPCVSGRQSSVGSAPIQYNMNWTKKLAARLQTEIKLLTILDDKGNPVVNMKKKIKTVHGRWSVYRGTSKDEKDLVFKVRKSHMIQHKTKLHVFLKGNDTEEACDFRVESFKKNCTVYVKDTGIIIALMHIEDRVGRNLFGIDRFAVTVYPSVDQAFITALIVLLDEID